MSSVPLDIQLRQIGHFTKANPAYGADVTRELGINAR
jgi:catalase